MKVARKTNIQRKIRVGILFGGVSSEHEISIMSARNVVAALDKSKYSPVLIYINKQGEWYRVSNFKLIDKLSENQQITFDIKTLHSLDVVFPVLHGTNGEDGTIQGLLKLAGVAFVGPGVLGSSVGMDKDVSKRLLRDAGIPIAKFIVVRKNEKLTFAQAKKQLRLPMFVKPANNGSSVGVSKVKNKSEFGKAVREAFEFDNKILIEEGIDGREIECSVLGNENPKASIPGEVITSHEFYSYEAKYFDENGSRTEIPAGLPSKTIHAIQKMAVDTFKTLNCEGMARVDFFVDRQGKICLNEINTIPGFTNISMYPKLWEASGISYSKLIDKLISLSIERMNSEKKLKTNFG